MVSRLPLSTIDKQLNKNRGCFFPQVTCTIPQKSFSIGLSTLCYGLPCYTQSIKRQFRYVYIRVVELFGLFS